MEPETVILVQIILEGDPLKKLQRDCEKQAGTGEGARQKCCFG